MQEFIKTWAFFITTLQKPFGLVCWGNTSLQNTCVWKCLVGHRELCMQLLLTLQGHLPLSFNIQCLWHFSMHVYRRCHPPVVTTLQWRNSVKSELGRGYKSELECNPQILLRGEGNFAGLPTFWGSWRVQEEDCLPRKEGKGFAICEFPNQLY